MSKINLEEAKFSALRIIFIEAGDIYYETKIKNDTLEIKNNSEVFNKYFSDLMPINLDLLYLKDTIKKLRIKKIGEEYYTTDFINVSFSHSLKVDEETQERLFKVGKKKYQSISTAKMREEFYKNGFFINGHRYVRYKRSAGSAKGGSCLFVRDDLYGVMNDWSKTGLEEDKDLCFDSLTAYEAYKALSLSSLIKYFKLNPYHILFVKDFEHFVKDQEVVEVKAEGQKGKQTLVASRTKCEVKNNLFDGEGLLDVSIFKKLKLSKKGMMLLRNRFFKCCAFNTNLQEWFKANNITAVEQLNGYTFTKNIEDIVLVVSESCLKYLKMCKGGFSKENIWRWCEEVSDPHDHSLFGVVKCDKDTRFFDGEMVETTYQLLNTLQLKKNRDINLLINGYIDYIKKIRDIKETPEYVKLYLQGEVKEENEEYEDDSEDDAIASDIFDYSSYSFKNKICYDLMNLNGEFIKTDLFKYHIFKNVVNSFRLKLFDGRILVDGTYATLFGNPIEYLKYIIKNDGKPLFGENNITSSLNENEIYCSFFENNTELVGSRAPHMTMGNLLYAKNKKPEDIDRWFNLSRNIVIVDAINNNIQQRLNGADYDSDTMLITNNRIIVDAVKSNYQRFPVPVAAFGHEDKKLLNKSANKKENIALNLYEIDNAIARNNVGTIVNLSQKLNSHLWDKVNTKGYKDKINEAELYNQIATLAVLAGAEIDSAKRSFGFKTISVLNKVRAFAKDHGYERKPAFFFYVASGDIKKPKIGKINNKLKDLEKKDFFKTTMDYLWEYTIVNKIEVSNINTIPLSTLLSKNDSTKRLTGTNYDQVKAALPELENVRKIINKNNKARNKSISYEVEKRQFNDEIKEGYDKIKTAIKSVEKAKYFIRYIEENAKTPSSLHCLLLYIIAINKEELGYSLGDLFEQGNAIRGLKRVEAKTDFSFFEKYYYKPVK